MRLKSESIDIDTEFIKTDCISDKQWSIVVDEMPYSIPLLHSSKIKIMEGCNTVWSCDKYSYYGKFTVNAISEKYGCACLLLNVNLYNTQPVIINLRDLTSTNILPAGLYYEFGHMYSFNSIYYRLLDDSTFYCMDLDTGETQKFIEDAIKIIPLLYKWSICPVKDCVLVMTIGTTDNLILYNVKKHEIVQTATFPVREAKKYSFGMYFDKMEQRVIIKSFCPTEPLGSDVQCYSVYFD